MAKDLVWLLVFPISALLIAALRHQEGPVLRIPDGADGRDERGAPPSSTWPVGTGPHRDRDA